MIGDKLLINDYHRQAAKTIYNRVKPLLEQSTNPVAVTVAGESGSGKSETAAVLAALCESAGYQPQILQQDDYFILPPKSNHQKRLTDLDWVGPGEVKLDLIEEQVGQIKLKKLSSLTKPLVNYELNMITDETIKIDNIKIVIIEGTYTTLIKNADLRAFIDRTYRQTKKARLARSRDPLTAFLEKVLAIEHRIISAHKSKADLIIAAPQDDLLS